MFPRIYKVGWYEIYGGGGVRERERENPDLTQVIKEWCLGDFWITRLSSHRELGYNFKNPILNHFSTTTLLSCTTRTTSPLCPLSPSQRFGSFDASFFLFFLAWQSCALFAGVFVAVSCLILWYTRDKPLCYFRLSIRHLQCLVNRVGTYPGPCLYWYLSIYIYSYIHVLCGIMYIVYIYNISCFFGHIK